MKIVTQLYGRGDTEEPHGQPIGMAELTLESYERWTGTGHWRGRKKVERFNLFNNGDTIMVRVIVVEMSGRHWPGMGRVRKYRLVVEDLPDVMVVRHAQGKVWRDKEPRGEMP